MDMSDKIVAEGADELEEDRDMLRAESLAIGESGGGLGWLFVRSTQVESSVVACRGVGHSWTPVKSQSGRQLGFFPTMRSV